MITNTFILIFGGLMFGIWIVGSILEFRRMMKKPKKFQRERAGGFES